MPELPDALATIEQPAETNCGSSVTTYQLDLEVDGAYYRTMLKAKVASYAQVCAETGRPLLWVTRSPIRAKHIEREIALVRARHFIQVLVLPKNLAAEIIRQLYPAYNALTAGKDEGS